MHPIYKKRFVVSKKYYIHDENNESKVGDTIKFRECRPLSKLKKRKLIEIIK
jgi:small subunit ribosomal protein S17